jgi:energy-coupling factor transport system substrate-specific component
MKFKTRELILFGVLGGLLSASQIALSFIPNIEIVTLLIILFSMIYKKKALYIVYVFVMVMGVVYGFGLWWIGYIILWPFLSILTLRIRRFIEGKYLVLAIYSGIFGFLFGFFYAIPYVFFGGLNMGIVYWISGLQFDIIHGIGNFFMMILLGEKLFDLLNKLNNRYLIYR